MVGDQVVGQFVVQRYGMDIYVTLAGKLSSQDGYVGLKPSLFKVGDLNVPISWVDSTLQSKLADPENREKLKLPPFVSEIRVENGELVIVEKVTPLESKKSARSRHSTSQLHFNRCILREYGESRTFRALGRVGGRLPRSRC